MLQGILQVLLVYKSLKVVGGLVQSQKALKLLKDRAKGVKDAFVSMKNVFKLTEKAQTLHTKATKAQEKAEKATTRKSFKHLICKNVPKNMLPIRQTTAVAAPQYRPHKSPFFLVL